MTKKSLREFLKKISTTWKYVLIIIVASLIMWGISTILIRYPSKYDTTSGWIGFFGSFFGSIIGGMATMFGVIEANKNNSKMTERILRFGERSELFIRPEKVIMNDEKKGLRNRYYNLDEGKETEFKTGKKQISLYLPISNIGPGAAKHLWIEFVGKKKYGRVYLRDFLRAGEDITYMWSLGSNDFKEHEVAGINIYFDDYNTGQLSNAHLEQDKINGESLLLVKLPRKY